MKQKAFSNEKGFNKILFYREDIALNGICSKNLRTGTFSCGWSNIFSYCWMNYKNTQLLTFLTMGRSAKAYRIAEMCVSTQSVKLGEFQPWEWTLSG